MKPTTKIFLVTIMLFLSRGMQASTFYSVTNGDWSSGSTWSTISCGGASCGCTPSNGDNVIICAGTTVTSAGNINVGPGGSVISITIQSGGTLGMDTNYMDVKTGGTLTVSGTLRVGSLLFDNNSIVNVTAGGTIQDNGNFTNKNNSNNIVIDGSMTVSGNASLGNGSTIAGGGLVTVDGTSSGTGTVYGNSTGCSGCSFSNAPLPVKLSSFTASCNNDVVTLLWTTASETNNKLFTIERTTGGMDYSTVVEVQGAGTSSRAHNYSAVDTAPVNGVNYYRLKQTDYDGHYTYSGVIVVTVNKATHGLKIFPNPANDNCIISFTDNKAENFVITVSDCTGRIISEKDVQTAIGINSIALDLSSFARGIYFISLPANGSVINGKLLKN